MDLARVGGRSAPDLADIDADGDLDALVGEFDGDLFLIENTGTAIAPAFAAPIQNPFGLEPVFRFATPDLADIDDDGDLDALVGESIGNLILFENVGTASSPAFGAGMTNPFGLARVDEDSAPELADLDADGDFDALVGDETGTILYFENTGTSSAPAFATPVTNPFGLADVGDHSAPLLADIDADGDLDALIGAEGGKTIFFENTGTASAPAFVAGPPDAFGLSGVGSFCSPALGDVDGDGDLDGYFGEFFGDTIFLANTGTAAGPAFAPPDWNPFRLPMGWRTGVALADLDADGDLDALSADSSGIVSFAENTGGVSTPSFGIPVPNPFGIAGPNLRSPELGDIDGDLDAFIGDSDINTIFFENTGTAMAPSFAAPVSNPFGLMRVDANLSPVLVDIDDDGDLDALLGGASGHTFLFENTGTAMAPAFAAPVRNPFGLVRVTGRNAPALVDLDGDGDLDAFHGLLNGNTSFFVNSGTPSEPSFGAPGVNPFGLMDIGSGTSLEIADIEGDGDPDLFLSGSSRTFFFENTPVDLGCPPAADPGCTEFGAGSLQINETKPGKEKLAVKLDRGPAFPHAVFGNPFESGSTSYALCLYDDADALAGALTIDRAGHVCGPRPCWIRPGIPPGVPPPAGNGILVYKDKEASADGVSQILLIARHPNKSSILLKAANKASQGQNELPTGLAAALSTTTSVTVQLRASDAGCFATTLDEFARQQPDNLTAR